jgi:tryptophan-rich sensory protein
MLLLPYLACTLNYEIGRLNPDADGAFGSTRTVRVEI